MKSKTTSTLQILTGVFAALHFILTVMLFSRGELSFLNPIEYLSIVSLLIVISCFALSWTRQKMVGIMLMVWNASIWIHDLLLFRGGEEGEGVLTFPVIVIGAFFLLEWYKTSKATMPSEQQQWKFILRVLLINYAVLYSIVVLSDLFHGDPVNYFSFPLMLSLLIFWGGFLLSWKREFLAGFIFLFWFAISLFADFAFSEIRRMGPWFLFGLPILLQGIFYIKNHYQFRSK